MFSVSKSKTSTPCHICSGHEPPAGPGFTLAGGSEQGLGISASLVDSVNGEKVPAQFVLKGREQRGFGA